MSWSEYVRLAEAGVRAFHAGNRRDSANQYWAAFRVGTAPALGGPWTENRYVCFHGYTSILKEKYFRPSDEDLENLTSVMNDKHEPYLYRSEAAFSLGVVSWDRGDREMAADCYRDCIDFNTKVKNKEKKKKVMFNARFRVVGELIQEAADQARSNLDILVNPSHPRMPAGPMLRSDGTYINPSQASHVIQTPLNDPDLLRRMAVGGEECDECHQTLKELGVPKLDICSNCKMAYYCSKKCQRAAWKAGHKDACRKPDERRPGDMMRLQQLEARPELNGRLVTVEGPTQNGRWKVSTHPEKRVLSVATEKLVHIRPAK